MKPLRLVLISAGALAALLVAAGVLVSNSGFQTWAVRRALQRASGLEASVGRIDAGLGTVRAENLRVAFDGGPILQFPELELHLSLIRLFSGRLDVAGMVAHGWTADFTSDSRSGANAIAGSRALAGSPMLLQDIQLPMDLSVGSVDLEGEMLLPAAEGIPPVRARITLSGGGLGSDREATFNLEAQTLLAPGAAVNSLNGTGTVTLAMPTPRTLSSVDVRLDLEAVGRSLPGGARLSLTAGASRADAVENYSLALRSSGRELFSATAAPVRGGDSSSSGLAGDWSLDVDDSDLTPFALGREIPTFSAQGSGRFELHSAAQRAAISGRLNATVRRLGLIREELGTVGSVDVAAEFDVERTDGALRVDTLSAQLSDGSPILAVRTTQPFDADLSTGALHVDGSGEELLRVDLTALPASWLGPFAGMSGLTGGVVRGSIVASVQDEGFEVRSVGPLIASSLALEGDDGILLSNLNASTQLTASITAQGWQAELGAFEIRSLGSPLLSGGLKAGRLAGPSEPIKVQGNWTADLASIGRQPAAAPFARVTSGALEGDFLGSVGGRDELQAHFALGKLELEGVASSLSAMSADVRLDRESDGTVTLNVPIAMDAGDRHSDLTFSGTLVPESGSWKIDARAESDSLDLKDAGWLASLHAAPGPGGSADAPSASVRGSDSVPFWGELGGQIAVAFRNLSYGGERLLAPATGIVRMETGSLQVGELKAGTPGDGNLTGTARLRFEPSALSPYTLQGEIDLLNFDSAPILRALGPDAQPVVEGRFDVSGRFGAKGNDPGSLADNLTGQFEVSSRGGVSRLLRANLTVAIQNASSRIAAMAGLIGTMTGRDSLTDFANRGAIVSDVAKQLGAVPFHQLSFVAVRGPNRITTIRDFSLIAPEMRLDGAGAIAAVPGRRLAEQEMLLHFELGVRGGLAEQMNRVGLLDGRRDDLGYSSFISPFTISGSLEKPNITEFVNSLLRAAGADPRDSGRP